MISIEINESKHFEGFLVYKVICQLRVSCPY
jgi:hypothetical protein